MMFAITIAPTTSEIPEIRIISRKAPWEKLRHRACSISAVTMPNGSSLSNFVLRSDRRIVRTSSVAALAPSTPPTGLMKIAMSCVGAMWFLNSVSGMYITLSRL